MTKDVNVGPIHDDIGITQNKATMCCKIIYNDAEAHCDSIPKRSITCTVQILAQRKSRKQSVKQNKATRQSAKHQSEPAESRVEPKKLFSS